MVEGLCQSSSSGGRRRNKQRNNAQKELSQVEKRLDDFSSIDPLLIFKHSPPFFPPISVSPTQKRVSIKAYRPPKQNRINALLLKAEHSFSSGPNPSNLYTPSLSYFLIFLSSSTPRGSLTCVLPSSTPFLPSPIYELLAAWIIVIKSLVNDAPPTRNPSMSGFKISPGADEPFTDPP